MYLYIHLYFIIQKLKKKHIFLYIVLNKKNGYIIWKKIYYIIIFCLITYIIINFFTIIYTSSHIHILIILCYVQTDTGTHKRYKKNIFACVFIYIQLP